MKWWRTDRHETDRFSTIFLADAVKRISFSVLETLKFAFLVKKANLSRNLISLRKENWDICLATTPLQHYNRKMTLQSFGLWSAASKQAKQKCFFLFKFQFVSWSCNSDINGSKASMATWRLEGANWQIAGILLPSIMFWRRQWYCWYLFDVFLLLMMIMFVMIKMLEILLIMITVMMMMTTSLHLLLL